MDNIDSVLDTEFALREKGEVYHDLHIKAGLTPTNTKDADGEDEYIGTKAQWKEYEDLVNEYENGDNDEWAYEQ